MGGAGGGVESATLSSGGAIAGRGGWLLLLGTEAVFFTIAAGCGEDA